MICEDGGPVDPNRKARLVPHKKSGTSQYDKRTAIVWCDGVQDNYNLIMST